MLEIDLGHPLSHMMLGLLQLVEGDPSLRLLPLSVSTRRASGMAPRVAGSRVRRGGTARDVRSLRDELHARAASSYVSPFAFALMSLGLGDVDRAFIWMDNAIDVRDPFVVPLRNYPFLDPLRSDPRFTALLTKMNLATGVVPGSAIAGSATGTWRQPGNALGGAKIFRACIAASVNSSGTAQQNQAAAASRSDTVPMPACSNLGGE